MSDDNEQPAAAIVWRSLDYHLPEGPRPEYSGR